jgi:hypothetical protein
MMKPPDEVKKGLQLCSNGNMRECMQCPYPIGFECFEQPMKDALAYIQQLESRLAQVERERDAAVKVMRLVRLCENCKHCDKPCESYPCSSCAMDRERSKPNWEWRGVCPENSKEEK